MNSDRDFIDDGLRRLIGTPEGLESVLEGLARLPADVGVRLLEDLGDEAPADLLEALLFSPEPAVHRTALRLLEDHRSVRSLLALEHFVRVAPAWTAATAARERMENLRGRGELLPWSPLMTLVRAVWSLPDRKGSSALILIVRSGDDTQVLMVNLDEDGTINDAAGRWFSADPKVPWKSQGLAPLSAAQARSVLLEAERATLGKGKRLPPALLAWQSVRWASAPQGSTQLDAFARELRALVPFRATYRSDHDCADCASINGRRMTVLEAVDKDPQTGIACRVSLGSAEDLAPLVHLHVGTRHRARALLTRYGYWCREHVLG